MKFNRQLMTYDLRLITAISVLLVVSYLSLIGGINAQTPARVIFTWQANNFYPADFRGKALATPNTPVVVAVEVLRNGKFVDLSRATFTWYVDEKLLSRAEGLKEIVFTVKKMVGDSYFVRVNIQSENDVFEGSIRIPVSKPVVVLETPYPNQIVSAGSEAALEAIPYFFNVASFENFIFSWAIDNGPTKESGSDNRLVLNIGNAPPGNSIQITSAVRNRNNLLEFATTRTRLIIY